MVEFGEIWLFKSKSPALIVENQFLLYSVLTHQIENKLRNEIEAKQKIKEEKLTEEKKKLEIEKNQLEIDRKNAQVELAKKVNEKLASERISLWKQAQAEAGKEKEAEKKMLEEQLAEKDLKLKQANQKELELRKEKQKLKDEKDAFEIEKSRQLDEERKKIEEDASRKATDAKQGEIDQLNKKLSDATKAKDELARKLEQGSQQTQGEVQELALEELLKNEFIYDDIVPVGKGMSGADVVQTVKTKTGIVCGTIIWESKKTKAWTENWIQKLKDDQRTIKADIAVIISSVLPPGTHGIITRDTVWVCDIKLAISLALLLRNTLEAISKEKLMSTGKDQKMELLYFYLTGTEFKQRIETIVETFSAMKSSLNKEKIYFEKSWAEKEKQIEKVIKNTVGIYGDLNGLVTLPQIQALELENGEKLVREIEE
jgi:hypothetical protein